MSSNVVSINNDLIAAVQTEMDEHDLSQAAVARESGVNASALNRWLKGRYPGDNVAVNDKLGRWLDARTTRRATQATLPDAPAWLETPSARKVVSGLLYAQMAGDISVIYGGAGVGKTMTAKHHQTQSPNVWIATMTPATAVLGSALERIALAIGLRPSGRAARIEGEIIEKLRDTQGLLIIDEAQHLGPRALEGVRSLQDATGIGVAIMGNEIVYAQLTGGTRSMGFAQLFSRIGKRVRLTRPKSDDIDTLLDAWQIDDKQSRRLLHEIAKKPGALRAVTKTLRLAAMFSAGSESEQPSLSHIRAAWRDLGGE